MSLDEARSVACRNLTVARFCGGTDQVLRWDRSNQACPRPSENIPLVCLGHHRYILCAFGISGGHDIVCIVLSCDVVVLVWLLRSLSPSLRLRALC